MGKHRLPEATFTVDVFVWSGRFEAKCDFVVTIAREDGDTEDSMKVKAIQEGARQMKEKLRLESFGLSAGAKRKRKRKIVERRRG